MNAFPLSSSIKRSAEDGSNSEKEVSVRTHVGWQLKERSL